MASPGTMIGASEAELLSDSLLSFAILNQESDIYYGQGRIVGHSLILNLIDRIYSISWSINIYLP